MQNPDLTIEEAAAYLGCSVVTIYRRRRKGLGPHGYRIGMRLRFQQEELDRVIAQAITARAKRP